MARPKASMEPLRTPGLFESTDPTQIRKGVTLHEIPLDRLQSFEPNPFKVYEGQRLDDLVDSITSRGILEPVIVRPLDSVDGEPMYQILSGHNRVNAARIAEFVTVPAIIKESLSDEDALFIVTESNLIQRGFHDLSHSERGLTLSMHYEAVKKQGRASLIQEVEILLNTSDNADYEASSLIGNLPKSIDITGSEYGLSKNTVARYIRVNKLIQPLKDLLDDDKFGVYAAVELSYINEAEQLEIADFLESTNYKLDITKAGLLRSASGKNPFDRQAIERILTGKKEPKKTIHINIKLKPDVMEKYFIPGMKQREIIADIVEGLELLRAHRTQKGGDNL